jgi:hypothetical protein
MGPAVQAAAAGLAARGTREARAILALVSDASHGNDGVVIIRYTGPAVASGGTITSSGGDTIHTFTTSGTLTVS